MHLLMYISAHGFGHAAQSCAVLNALAGLVDELELTLVTRVDPAFLAGRLQLPYRLIERETDVGLVMHSGIEIDLPASAEAYRAFHDNWPRRVEAESRFLETLRPDALLSDISYLGIAAAAALGMPAVALCCLNWAGVYRHYFADQPEAGRIIDEILAAYHQARVFLTTPPVWGMPEIHNQRQTGLLARKGRSQRESLRRTLGLAPSTRLILVGLGGVRTRLPMENWPVAADDHWLVPAGWEIQRPDISAIEASGLSFSDLIASVDLVLGKTGYGLVSECAVNATPLVYIERPDWPEDQPFSAWLNRHGRCAPVTREQVEQGNIDRVMAALLSREAPESPQADAQRVARDCLAHLQ